MLHTVEFGLIRIVKNRPCYFFDTLIRLDLAYEYEYWQLTTGEIVAYEIPQE